MLALLDLTRHCQRSQRQRSQLGLDCGGVTLPLYHQDRKKIPAPTLYAIFD